MSENTMQAAVEASISAAGLDGPSAASAVVALAVEYARQIDGAADVAQALDDFDESDLPHNDRVSLAALRRRVGEAETLAVLGPKLLDALRVLGLAGPAAGAGTSPAGRGSSPTSQAQMQIDALAALRDRRRTERGTTL